MPIRLEIEDNQAQLLIEFYLERLKAIKANIVKLEAESKTINNSVQLLKRAMNTAGPTTSTGVVDSSSLEYDEKWTWVKKITFALETLEKPLTTKEIVDFLTEFEPGFLFERKKAVASVSSTLSTRSGPGYEFDKEKRDSGDTEYFLRENTVFRLEDDDDLPF